MINKKIFSSLVIIIALVIANGQLIASENTTEISLPTIQCGMCVRTIEKALNKVDGIINIGVNVENKKATVTYDDTKTDLSKIETAISKAGYDANNLKADEKAYEKLNECCKVK